MDYIASEAEQVLGVHPRSLDLVVPTGGAPVPATLNVPLGARAVVAIFTPTGRSRYDAPSRFFSRVLEQSGLATLTLDPPEDDRGDDPARVTAWLRTEPFTSGLPVGLLSLTSGTKLALAQADAWLVLLDLTPRAAELASEFFVARLLGAPSVASA